MESSWRVSGTKVHTETEADSVCSIATATYRLMPHIQIAPEGIPSDLCDKFAQCFAPGVIEVRKNRSTGCILLRECIFYTLTLEMIGKKEVVVKNPRRDTVSREVLRHPEFENLVQLGRIRDHFLCEFLHRAVDISSHAPQGQLRAQGNTHRGISSLNLSRS